MASSRQQLGGDAASARSASESRSCESPGPDVHHHDHCAASVLLQLCVPHVKSLMAMAPSYLLGMPVALFWVHWCNEDIDSEAQYRLGGLRLRLILSVDPALCFALQRARTGSCTWAY